MLPPPFLIEGGCHVDAWCSISFVNGFAFDGVERFYWIQSPRVGMQRGWEGHQREHKWFTVVAGEVQIAVVKPDDWQSPSADLLVARYVLSAGRPQPFHPSSFILSPSAPPDDFRFPVSHWPLGTL